VTSESSRSISSRRPCLKETVKSQSHTERPTSPRRLERYMHWGVEVPLSWLGIAVSLLTVLHVMTDMTERLEVGLNQCR